MMKTHHSHSYPLLSALLFFFFVTWSSSGSLLSIWLHQEVGLKAGDTGIIYAVLSVSALFAQICYGFIQDKLGLRKNLLWFLTSLLILSGPAFLLFGYLLQINVLLGSIFGGVFIGLTFNGGIGVLESYTCLFYTFPSPPEREKNRMASFFFKKKKKKKDREKRSVLIRTNMIHGKKT